MKKAISFIMAAALTAALIPAASVSAADTDAKDIVVFGDSVSAGITISGSVEHTYGDMLADYYSGTLANYSVSGADSDDLLNTVKSLSAEQKKAVEDAECVVISIGGNDIIGYMSKYMLNYFAKPNPGNNMKNFLKDGFTADDIPDDPTFDQLKEMVDFNSLKSFSKNMINAIELITQIRGAASQLRYTSGANEGYIKNHIIKNISDITAELKAINPDADIVVQNIYQPLQLEPAYINSNAELKSADSVIKQMRDVLEGIMATFDSELDKVSGIKKADILNEFTALDEGTKKSDSNPGHASYFVDIKAASLTEGDVHPNQKGHLAIASKIIDILGDTHTDLGLLSDVYENLPDKASYPATAFKTYENAAGSCTIGDVNFDGIIDGRDATTVLTDYAKTSAGQDSALRARQRLTAKVTNDDIIDGRDATFILTYYAKSSAGTEKGSFADYMKKNR